MAEIGHIALLIALVTTAYACGASLIGKIRAGQELVVSARYAAYVIPFLLGIAVIALIVTFVTRDFQVRYVFENSNRALDPQFFWVAFYAGNAGSLLFIATVFSILSALAIVKAPQKLHISLPYINAILMLILLFFLVLLTSLANPFTKLPFTPEDGQGINPLLIHFGMFIHPPIMMTGLVAVAIPFAFAMGSLLSGQTNDEWIDIGRTWGLIVWSILTIGLLLGAWWAYTILGWGGYWGWDPVENAGLMPWLPLTAFLHSVMVQKHRGMFRMWNVVLIIIAFGLAQYGMFHNRGGANAIGSFLRPIHYGLDIFGLHGNKPVRFVSHFLQPLQTSAKRSSPGRLHFTRIRPSS